MSLELAVLPSTNEITKILMFDLFDKKKKVYSTVELQIAIETGNTIKKNIVPTHGEWKGDYLRNMLNIFTH